jgi:hypothetical protein
MGSNNFGVYVGDLESKMHDGFSKGTGSICGSMELPPFLSASKEIKGSI